MGIGSRFMGAQKDRDAIRLVHNGTRAQWVQEPQFRVRVRFSVTPSHSCIMGPERNRLRDPGKK